MNKLIFLMLAIALLTSCQKSNDNKTVKDQPTLIRLVDNLEKSTPNRKFKDLFRITKVIKLQSDEQSFIASLNKMILVENELIILDKKYASVKVFDVEGKFINTIAKVGQGPGEFTRIFDMDHIENDNSLLIYSNDDMKMCKFGLDGVLKKETRVPFYSCYFTSIGNDSLVFFVNYNSSEYNDKHNLIVTDSKFNVLEKYFPYTRNFASSSSGMLVKSNNNILYNDAYEGNIYQFLNGKMYLKYQVDLGKYCVPLDMTQTFSSLAKHLLEYSYFERVATKTTDCLIFTFSHNRRSNLGIYFDKTKEIITNKNFTKNDIYQIISPPQNLAEDENQFFTYISPTTLGYIKDNPNFYEELKVDYPELYTQLKELKDSDNPIVIFFKKK
jgi:6-bladed beta-propeller